MCTITREALSITCSKVRVCKLSLLILFANTVPSRTCLHATSSFSLSTYSSPDSASPPPPLAPSSTRPARCLFPSLAPLSQGYLFYGNDDDNATLTDDLMYPGTVNLKDQGAHWIRKSGTVPQISAIPRFAPVVGTVRDCDVDERGPPLSLRVTTTGKSREMVITTPRALWDGKVPTAYDNRFLPRKHLTEKMLTKVTEPAKATRKARGKARERWERGRVKTYREKDGFLLPADRTHRRNMRRRKEQKKKQTEERRRKRQEERVRRELERQRLRQKRREEDATTSEEEDDDDDDDGAAGGGDSLDDTDEDEEREGDDDESGMMMGEVDARNRRTAPPPPAAAAAVNMRASTAAPRARKATPSGGSHDNGFRPRRAASRGAILGECLRGRREGGCASRALVARTPVG